MSNSPLSALVLIGVAGVVGTFAWMAGTDDVVLTEADVVTLAPATATIGPRVMALTPHERRLQGRLEGARRQLERYKREGTVLPSGAIVVPDVDGTPLFIHPELVEGKGRYGEPLFAMANYKKRAALPLRKKMRSLLPEKNQPKMARAKQKLSFSKRPSNSDGGGASTGASSSSGGGDAKKKNKGKKKPADG
ncbi:MAG: hypothetical protein DRQ55_02705 [Planctomycetota bacterium]|nr:MAG: hypothetical protein DRQ55_02705 [Planctomycetota bacterium]